MKAIMFVNGIEEMDNVIIMMKSVALDFDFKVINSFEFLVNQFEKEQVDVFICQLGLSNCDAKELLQLARMYNPNIINIATGRNDCVEELVDTFNTENLFRFISMPWLYKDDIITPIHDAIDSIHEKVQKEYDLKALEEDARVLKSKVVKLKEKDPFYNKLFADTREVLRSLALQNYHFTSGISKDEDMEFVLNVYDRYIRYFYNNIDDLNPLLHELVSEYREPKEGRFFTVKHNITGTVKDEVKSRIVFLIYALNSFVARYCKEYKINVVIGNTNNHYLIKYEYIFPGSFDTGFMDSINSFNYKMLMFYVNGSCAKSDITVNETGIECKIIVA